MSGEDARSFWARIMRLNGTVRGGGSSADNQSGRQASGKGQSGKTGKNQGKHRKRK